MDERTGEVPATRITEPSFGLVLSLMSHLTTRLLLFWCCWVGLFHLGDAYALLNEEGRSDSVWTRLLDEADRMQLPTKFLKVLPPDFIHFDFDDLRTYAAEYHPHDHRMVLNRSLSFNGAARTLKPLPKMTSKELEVLYHELFHAYLDYVNEAAGQSAELGHDPVELLRFARQQQTCRYGVVKIAPVVQRMGDTELRYLTGAESWEALNEAWAVFVGWVAWNQHEVQGNRGKSMFQESRLTHRWVERLQSTFQRGEFRGYYVPEDPAERRMAQKRFLAEQLTSEEAMVLMKQAIGFPDDFVNGLEGRLKSFKGSACLTPS